MRNALRHMNTNLMFYSVLQPVLEECLGSQIRSVFSNTSTVKWLVSVEKIAFYKGGCNPTMSLVMAY